jgi:hypothetical protein
VSGSAFSFVRPEAAREAGVESDGPNAPPAGDITGLAAKPIPSWIARFDTFEIGGETVKNASLRVGELFPDGTAGTPSSTIYVTPVRDRIDMSLGADFLQANHLIIVLEKQAALFTYNGGTIFQPERADNFAPGVTDERRLHSRIAPPPTKIEMDENNERDRPTDVRWARPGSVTAAPRGWTPNCGASKAITMNDGMALTLQWGPLIAQIAVLVL